MNYLSYSYFNYLYIFYNSVFNFFLYTIEFDIGEIANLHIYISIDLHLVLEIIVFTLLLKSHKIT